MAAATLPRLFWGAVTVAALAFAVSVAVDTLRAVVPLWSPLPWFDEWATVELIRAWQEGERSALDVLFAQHNEHRIFLPRLVFFADDLLFRGGGYLSLAAIFAVQSIHAGLFAAVLGRSRPARAGRWAVGAVVLALMFSLRQAENFSSGFQLQFVAVFAGATASFVLFGRAVGRERAGRPAAGALLASLAVVLATSFTMANGLVSGYVLVALAVGARMRPRVVLACVGWASVLTAVYLHGYEPVAHHAKPIDSLRHPLQFLIYVANYLGSVVASGAGDRAAGLGLLGIAGTGCAASRVLRQGRSAWPGSLAMLGVMLFVSATAGITASGRLMFGVDQALSSRYVTGSVAFWAAQLTYWWTDPPAVRLPGRLRSARPAPWSAVPPGTLARAAVVLLALALCRAVERGQGGAKPQLAAQSYAQNESADAFLLGLDDPAATLRAAWSDQNVQRLLPTLKADGLSIFATADARAVGRPLAERGRIGPPCDGAFSSAVADPALGLEGARVAGLATDGPRHRIVRRLILVDAAGEVQGLASGAVPGAERGAWRGYAVAPVGARLTVYGLVDRDRLCLVGAATVAAAAQASQPDEAP